MSAQRRISSAVIGTGFVGPHHVDAVRRGGIGSVRVIVDSNGSRLQERAEMLGVSRSTTEIDTVLSDPEIEIVHICTPNSTHAVIATAALEAGKHVVVEKPLAPTSTEAAQLAELALSKGLHAMVSFTYRGYTMVRRARGLVESGELGEVRIVHGSYLQDWLSDPGDFNWRLEKERGGTSRAVADIGMHWFDAVEYVSGLRVAEVMADLVTLIPQRWRPEQTGVAFQVGSGERTLVPIDTEDAATILLRFESGSRGALVVSQVSPGHRNDFSIDVSGSLLSLSWRQEDPEHIWLGSRSDARVLDRAPMESSSGVPDLPSGHPEGWSEALRDLLRPFYRAVASGLDPRDVRPGEYPTLVEGTRAVAFVEAALASSRSGRWEPINAQMVSA